MARVTFSIDEAAARLRAGDIVGMPTETVYGLAASVRDERALRRVFEVKKRPFFDPLIVHAASTEEARSMVRSWPRAAAALAERFWPGPLTLVLPKAPDVDPMITAGLDTVGVRVPARAEARRLIELAGAPLAAPSANRFGRTSPTAAQHVLDEFPGEDFLVLDAGPCDVGVESTVVAPSDRDGGADVAILRPGGVTAEEIEAALASMGGLVTVSRRTSAASPGHLEHHYQPDVPLFIIPEHLGSDRLALLRRLTKWKHSSRIAEVELDGDPAVAARKLYGDLRRLSAEGAQILVVKRDKSHFGGLWDAVWDRLSRAATASLTDEGNC